MVVRVRGSQLQGTGNVTVALNLLGMCVYVCMYACVYVCVYVCTYMCIQGAQALRSLLRDLIPELILSQKRHIHMGPIGNGSGVTSF